MIKEFKTLTKFKPLQNALRKCEHLSPNIVTVIGFIFLLFTLACLHYGQFALASIFLLLHLLSDGLDGHIARTYNKSSHFGFLLDHTLDRLSDLLLFPILGISVGHFYLGTLLAILCLLSSYIGILGRALGKDQDKSGPFGKAYRYQAIIIFLFLLEFLPNTINYASIFLVLFALVGFLTLVLRSKDLFSYAISSDKKKSP